ncbi:general transcription and DNA repair factor IIH subunit Ssl1p [[Candida] railenensis]|uniref:General transcription and DNA repair factor IIH n=1 Tax=[Candida] railenensis TaxID=45579 RepID=A0A9P0W1B1_9ASCO|nr:general transcription and DNA repair factor IIH subunit Ssl1p [[Candida] railenensis]
MDDSDDEYVAPHSRAGTSEKEDVEMDDVDDEDIGSSDMARRTRGRSATPAKAKPPGGLGGTVADMKTANGGYSWEDVYQRSWDVVKDGDDDGRTLDLLVQQMIENRKKKILKNSSTTPFQRGIIRTVIVVIDGSSTMSEKDLRPTRFAVMLSLLGDFIVEFFDQNPISQIGIVMMRNGIAYLVSEVSGSPQLHLEKIRQLRARSHNRYEPKGDPSLQNALEMSRSLLKISFGNNNNRNSKEILVILGALFTSDPGDIHKTIDNLVKDDIRCRVIGLSAQVAICQELVNRTNHYTTQTPTGRKIIPVSKDNHYGIIMNEQHFRELLMDCVVPLPVAADIDAEVHANGGVPLIKVGFPSKLKPTAVTMGLPQLCANNLENEQNESDDKKLDSSGSSLGSINRLPGSSQLIAYECPQCSNKVCHLPTVCPVCDLMLILSTHLARSYHHLIPLIDYKEVPVAESYSSTHCYGCLLEFPQGTKGVQAGALESYSSSRYRCPKCTNDFCIDCDVFVHETLHNCPGCESKQKI